MVRRLQPVLAVLAVVGGVALLGWLAWAWYQSRLPGTYDVMDYGQADFGGGPAVSGRPVSVSDLRGPHGRPDRRITLTTERSSVRLASGEEVDAWTFNGRVPGPELRVRQDDLVEVTLVNKDIDDGVSIHWHGVDVPNAEDGVSGVTQNSVRPGGRYVYRFRVHQVGTFWYHTHQDASRGVERGLYGALVILPRQPAPRVLDLTIPVHTFSGTTAIGTNDEVQRRAVHAGQRVRLRLLNTDSTPIRVHLEGIGASVVAIDGAEIDPAPLPESKAIEIGGGGRYDVAFSMPDRPVGVKVADSKAELVLSPSATGTPPSVASGPVFDPAARARASTPRLGRFNRTFKLEIGRHLGFLDGRFGYHWALNGKLYPRTPMFTVAAGDLVRIVLVNRSGGVHPMHLHGHHFLVLSRNGKAVKPWSTDTLNMLPHERYEVAFRANNRGLWMLHCHNLRHAADGLTMHLVYAGVTTPFRAGHSAHNDPE